MIAATFDPYSVFDFLKSNIYFIALLLLVAIGLANVIIEELISLVIRYKRLKRVMKSETPPATARGRSKRKYSAR